LTKLLSGFCSFYGLYSNGTLDYPATYSDLTPDWTPEAPAISISLAAVGASCAESPSPLLEPYSPP
jgi:hypothetical protein